MTKSIPTTESLDWRIHTKELPMKHLELVRTDVSNIINSAKIPTGAIKADIYAVLDKEGLPINYVLNYSDTSEIIGHEFLCVDKIRTSSKE